MAWEDELVDVSNLALEDGCAHDIGPFVVVPDTLLLEAEANGWAGNPILDATRPDGRQVFLFRRVEVN